MYKIFYKEIFVIIIVFCFALKGFAHTDHYKNIETIEMEIFKDGRRVGYNDYFFSINKKKLTVKNRTEFKVNLLGVDLYHVKGNSEEIYQNNQLISFKSETSQNKKNKFVSLLISDDGKSFEIDSSSFKGKINSNAVVGSWWNHSIIQAEKNISPITGSIRLQNVTFINKEKLKLNGNIFSTKHFEIKSKKNDKDEKEIKVNVWIDENTNHIIKITFLKFGLWEYKIKKIVYFN